MRVIMLSCFDVAFVVVFDVVVVVVVVVDNAMMR
jgi:hypothetical protein